jgi:hypothetical protein
MNQAGFELPSCYRRLKLYDPGTQRNHLGIPMGDRIVSLDLDALIVGNLQTLLRAPGRFVGWELVGSRRQRVLNGSLQMFTAGDLAFIWEWFKPTTSPLEAYNAGYLGSDQSWLSMHLAPHLDRDVNGLRWPVVASYSLQSKIQGLHSANRIIFFHGDAKPWMKNVQATTPWIRNYWREQRTPK